ncbi:MAG: ABC transporter ATP-binding protein [Acidimicrobiales bacterium]
MTAVLELRQVTKSYPGSPPIEVLKEIDLTITEGELVAIVGPSGSGKSTLLNMMGALDRPSSGQVLIDDTVVNGLGDVALSGVRGRRLGFVFQQFHLLAGLSATENVATGLLYHGTSRRDRKRQARQALERVGLGHRLDQKPGKLSGGERQRVAIARALLGDPAIVLADEPTGNLDSQTTEEIVQLFLDLNRQGSTIVMITHDRDLAQSMPRVVEILDGEIRLRETNTP